MALAATFLDCRACRTEQDNMVRSSHPSWRSPRGGGPYAWGSSPANPLDEVLPAQREPLLDLAGDSGEVSGRQVEQERAVQGGGELDGQHVEVGRADVDLPQQDPDVDPGQGRFGSGWYGLVAVQGGTGDVAVPDQESDPGLAVGDQAVQRCRARAQRRRAGKYLLLERPLVVVQQGLEDPCSGTEPAEHRPLAEVRLFGQRIHGELVRALLGEHLAG